MCVYYNKSEMINIDTLKALLDKMNFHSRAVLGYSAGILCQIINEMKERDISLDDILNELRVILGQSEYIGLLLCAGDHYIHHRFSIDTGHSEEEEAVYTTFDENTAGILFTEDVLKLWRTRRDDREREILEGLIEIVNEKADEPKQKKKRIDNPEMQSRDGKLGPITFIF